MSIYSYCMFMYLHRASWHSSATLTEVFPCFLLNCKANARIKPAKMGQARTVPKFLCCSMYCLFYVVLCAMCVCVCVCVCKCVLYCCHRVAIQLQLTNISYHKFYSGFRCEADETRALPGCYAEHSGNSLPMF